MTITISPELEQRLRNRAAQERQDLDTVVEALLSAVLDWEALDRADTIAGIQRGLDTSDAGGTRPTSDVFAEVRAMLAVAMEEARQGLAEGGIPIGAALFDEDGRCLGRGHNRRVQEDDPSIHGETDAFRKAGRQRDYRRTTMVTTLAPCWYCSGLVRQFRIGTVVVGDSVNFEPGSLAWLRECGIEVIEVNDPEWIAFFKEWVNQNPGVWHEDIGVAESG